MTWEPYRSSLELPDYVGAPGDPGFEALFKEQGEAAGWSLAEHDRLGRAWRRLLRHQP